MKWLNSIVLLIASVCLVSCGKDRMPRLYVIPNGFDGWISIDYGCPETTPLEVIDGKLVLKIGVEGHLRTSSSIEYGFGIDKYVYEGTTRKELAQTAWGGGGMIWGGELIGPSFTGDRSKVQERFFVGKEAEYRRSIGQKE